LRLLLSFPGSTLTTYPTQKTVELGGLEKKKTAGGSTGSLATGRNSGSSKILLVEDPVELSAAGRV